MTDDDVEYWERRALATTARAVERPEGVESLQYEGCWNIADAILDIVERLRAAEARVKELEDEAEERRQEAMDRDLCT